MVGIAAQAEQKEISADETSAVISRDFGPPCAPSEFAERVTLLGPDFAMANGTLSVLHAHWAALGPEPQVLTWRKEAASEECLNFQRFSQWMNHFRALIATKSCSMTLKNCFDD